MKRALLILAVLILCTTLGTWLITGASRGWTKTIVPVKTLDTVTGIEGISYQKKFVAGVDFLGAGLAVSFALAGTSLFFRKQQKNKQEQPQK